MAEKNNGLLHFGAVATGFGLVAAFTRAVWGDAVIPFGFFEFWSIKGTPIDWMFSAWPIFAWALGVTMLSSLIRGYSHRENSGDFFVNGFWVSVRAGFFEEIFFRWLIFLGCIATVQLGNVLVFGFLGFGIPEFFHTHLFGPLANWASLGHLRPYLFHSSGWAVGAAMILANAKFRDGHKYLGPIGYVNSWFIGLYFFWLMFQYGLVAAIVVHFTYDLIIFWWHAFAIWVRDSVRR